MDMQGDKKAKQVLQGSSHGLRKSKFELPVKVKGAGRRSALWRLRGAPSPSAHLAPPVNQVSDLTVEGAWSVLKSACLHLVQSMWCRQAHAAAVMTMVMNRPNPTGLVQAPVSWNQMTDKKLIPTVWFIERGDPLVVSKSCMHNRCLSCQWTETSWLDVQGGLDAKQVLQSSHSEMGECNNGLFSKEKGGEERLAGPESSAASRPGASAPALPPINTIQVNFFTPFYGRLKRFCPPARCFACLTARMHCGAG